MNLLIQCFIAGILGIAFQVVIKLISLKKRTKAANVDFHPRDYFRNDYLTICLSLLTVAVAVFALDEITKARPVVMEYIKFFFIAVGYAGSSVMNAILSTTEKKLLAIVDKKTDIADGKADA